MQDITLGCHRSLPVTAASLTLFDKRYYPLQWPRANAREMLRILTKQASNSEDARAGMIKMAKDLDCAAAG